MEMGMANPLKAFGWMLVCTAFVAGCTDEQEVAAPDVARPVKTMVIPLSEVSGLRSFPARVESTRRAEVSFRVPGRVIELSVEEGQRVERGEIIAELDPTDYQLVVDDRQATMFRAKKDFERAKPLAEKGFLPKKVFDQREADFKSANAKLRIAKQNLNYTTLKAPFGGEISRRLVENGEDVVAKQPVVELRDLSALEVKFDVPEQIMLRVTGSLEATEEAGPEPELFASFEAAPGRRFPLDFREVATTADPATRTFEATYTLDPPEDLLVLPGMTATVTADLGEYLDLEAVIYVPVEAVAATNELDARVWVVDEDTMTVAPKPIKVGRLRGSNIQVREGLEAGERIVIAGVPFLYEGMKVTLMAMSEQAIERGDDAKIRRDAERGLLEAGATAPAPESAAE